MNIVHLSENGSHVSNGKVSQTSSQTNGHAKSHTTSHANSHWPKRPSQASISSSASDTSSTGCCTQKLCTRICCFCPGYYGRPLEDRLNTDGSTFIVLVDRLGKPQVFRFSKAKSLYLFGQDNPIRRCVLFIVTNQFFEFFILLTILVNCVFLALSDPPEEPEYVFAAIYTSEMFLKIIARGFALHKFAYLRDPWNWLDFTVVILGYVTLSPNVGNLSGIRTFRVFRALRTISAIKGLKTMVNTLLVSMKSLLDVMILTLFFICIFALIGMQLFMGILQNKCVTPPPANLTVSVRTYASNSTFWLAGADPVVCGNNTGGMLCPANYSCLPDTGTNPNYGYTSFDHFGWATLTSFQLITLDFWEDVYNKVIYAVGPWYVIYFIFVIFVGPFYLINLILAVVAASYENEIQALKKESKEKKGSNLVNASNIALPNRKSIFDLVYGQGNLSLNETVHKAMYNKAVTCSQPSVTNSEIENKNVFQIRPEVSRTQSSKLADLTVRLAMQGSVESQASVKTNASTAKLSRWSTSKKHWRDFQKHSLNVVSSKLFEAFIILCIILNTLFMAIEHYGMDQSLKDALELGNKVFTFIFLLEMILKLIALTPKTYVKSAWNIFDGLVVIISLIDLILEYFKLLSGTGTSVLRTFRLLRVLKLAKSWSTMANLLSTIAKCLGALGNLTLILLIITYIFAVVGMQLFGSSYTPDKFDGEVPRWNFKDFGHSFLMIFRVLCGEFIEPLWDAMRAAGYSAILLFVSAIVLGNFIILNLFIALLLSSFGSGRMKRKTKSKKNKVILKLRAVVNLMTKVRKTEPAIIPSHVNPTCGETSDEESPAKADGRFEETTENNAGKKQENGNLSRVKEEVPESSTDQRKQTCCCTVDVEEYHVDDFFPACCLTSACAKWQGCTFCDVWLCVRYKTKQFVENRIFEWFIVLMIAASSIALGNTPNSKSLERARSRGIVDRTKEYSFVLSTMPRLHARSRLLELGAWLVHNLAFEDIYLDERPVWKEILDKLNIFFAVLFTVEFCLKIIALGVVSYFKSAFNCLDFGIVVISLIIVFGNDQISVFRSLRTLRALRPLRAISRFEGMRMVISSLIGAIPGIANVLLVCGVFWLIFSIMGVQIFGGKFFKCTDPNGEKYPPSVVPNRTACLLRNDSAVWVNSNINFDNVIYGFLALFQVATFEGWMEIMEDAVDATGIDKQPEREHNFAAYLYFVIFITLGSFFILNLFIGVIIDNFNRLKQQMEDCGTLDIFLTPSQRQWMNTLKNAATKKPKKKIMRPKNRVQGLVFDMVQSKKFEVFIMSVITCNMVVMMVEHYDQPVEVTMALGFTQIFNLIFTTVFIFEAILRLTALRLRYFKSPWNTFDFTIVIFSIAGIVLENLQQSLSINPSLLRVVRVFRIGRLLRFFESARGIRKLLFSLMVSVPALFNIGALLFLVMFIYAIFGMSLFGHVKKTGALNSVVNFETFGSSMVLLFRLMTSAGWNDILDPLMLEPPGCDPAYKGYSNGNCGNKILAMIYFWSFIVIIFLILTNMYIAIILENYNQAQEQEKIGISNEDIDLFYQEWACYDPSATQYIKYNQLSDFVDSLEGTLRIKKPNKAACALLNIPLVNYEFIHCLDILQALVKRVVAGYEDLESEGFQLVLQRMEERFSAAFPQRNKHQTTSTTMEIKAKVQATRVIIRAIRSYKERKLLSTVNDAMKQKVSTGEEIRGFTDLSGVQETDKLDTAEKQSSSETTVSDVNENRKEIPLKEIEKGERSSSYSFVDQPATSQLTPASLHHAWVESSRDSDSETQTHAIIEVQPVNRQREGSQADDTQF